MRKRAIVIAAIVLGGGLASFGTATAVTGLNDAGQPGSRVTSKEVVPATPAGMPPTSQVLFGVVNSNGTLARGFGATAAVRDAVGVYRVTFRQNISGCAFNGTIGLAGNLGIEAPGEIQVVTANVNPAQVFVTTRNSAGAFADRGFHLTVAC